MAEKVCESPDCSRVIPPQRGSSRPRKFCEVCRPSRKKPNPTVIKLAPAGDITPPTPSAGARPGLVASTMKRLEQAGRLDTPHGEHALLLTQMFAAGGHTAAGAASLSREWRAALAAALEGAPAEPDAMDEMAKRRAAKAAGA